MKVEPIRNKSEQPMWSETTQRLVNAIEKLADNLVENKELANCPNVLGDVLKDQKVKKCPDDLDCKTCWKHSIIKLAGLKVIE